MSMPTVAEEIHASQKGRRTRRLKLASLPATICVDLVAGCVAWGLVRPGESLLWPTALVAFIAVLPLIAFYYSLKPLGGWKRHRRLSLSVAASCVIPILWSYFGVLPASVSWNSTAASWIHTSIQEGAQGCRVVSTGSVGFLSAPYKVCVNQDGSNSTVQFSTMDLSRGYAYVQGKTNLNWFPDQCARELLLPHWWAFYNPAQSANSCPFGFPAHGGG